MIEVRKNPDGTYSTSCKEDKQFYSIEGSLLVLKDIIEEWLDEYGQDASLRVGIHEHSYGETGLILTYWRPSKKSEINRYEKELEEKRKEEERRTKKVLEEKLRSEENEKKEYERLKKKYEKSQSN